MFQHFVWRTLSLSWTLKNIFFVDALRKSSEAIQQIKDFLCAIHGENHPKMIRIRLPTHANFFKLISSLLHLRSRDYWGPIPPLGTNAQLSTPNSPNTANLVRRHLSIITTSSSQILCTIPSAQEAVKRLLFTSVMRNLIWYNSYNHFKVNLTGHAQLIEYCTGLEFRKPISKNIYTFKRS